MENTALKLLKMREVKELTGFSLSECYGKAQRREWDTVRDGNSVRVPAAALARWIAKHTVPAEDSTELGIAA